MVFGRKKQTIGYDDERRGRAPLPTNPARSRSNIRTRNKQNRDPSGSTRGGSTTRSSSTGRSISRVRSSSRPRALSLIRTGSITRTDSFNRGSSNRSISLTRSSSSSRRIRNTKPQPPGASIPTDDERANKFVQYKEFGNNPMDLMRVISINEIPALINPSDVIVKVKASLVSLKDCYIRRGIWPEKVNLPGVSGFELVGSVIIVGADVQREGVIQIGDAVGACCRTGGNSRYAVIPSSDLVKIPGGVDSAQAASVITNYMTAYQALHRLKPRGRKETLEGINILVTGGNGPIGQAVIELGFRAGASKIFVTAEKKYHGILHEQGVCPLPLDADAWLPLVKGKMDVVIDGICQDGYASPRAALSKTGHLIIIGMTLVMNNSERGWFGTPMDASVQTFATKFMSRTSVYDPYRSSQTKPNEWKHDLDYLMKLLERGKICPKITKRISLEAVPLAQQELEAGNVDGLIVCKPWK